MGSQRLSFMGPTAMVELSQVLVGQGITSVDLPPAIMASGEIQWQVFADQTDTLGIRHIFYRQVLKPTATLAALLEPAYAEAGVELLGGLLGVHLDGEAALAVFGAQHRQVVLKNEPTIAQTWEAFQLTQDGLGRWPSFKVADWTTWPQDVIDRHLKKTRLLLVSGPAGGSFRFTWEVPTVDRDGAPFLAYLDAGTGIVVEVSNQQVNDRCTHSTSPVAQAQGVPENKALSARRSLRAAQVSGRTPFTHEAHWPAPGTNIPRIKVFMGVYPGSPGYETYACPGNFYGVLPLKTVGGVVTYDHWFEQQDVWGDAGGDAMYFTYLTMRTFRDSFGRWSFDGNGDDARVVINIWGSQDTSAWIEQGDLTAPSRSVGVYPFAANRRHASAALDSVAHEWGHGIAFGLPSPPPYGWCNSIGGQLHEGFADVIGHFVERKQQPIWPFGGYGFEAAEWMFMEDARNYSDPVYRRVDLDDRPADYLFHANETAANSYCQSQGYPPPREESHQRGNMLPAAFRLLASGGVNPACSARGLGCGITVTGLGLDKAGKILYRMWTSYVQANADWYMLLDMAKTAAYDLYKNCPSYSAIPEQQSVEQAFNAIGYGSPGYYHTCP